MVPSRTDAKQLATYNGLQGAFCGQPDATVWMWPVEHNAWGPAGTRVIMRPTGAREYVVHDHLGSARLTLDNTGQIVESRSYRAFGTETSSAGEGARTSYIGRENDNESDLGFYGVRMYEPTYGRFLSVDPLWGKHKDFSPYQYVRQRPLDLVDFSGLDSAQRAEAVEKATSYLGSGSTYGMGSKGEPGRPVDCSGMVSKCVMAGGEKDPNRGSAPSGVLNIEANTTRIDVDDAEAGNIVTFRNTKPGAYPYHTGIISSVQRDGDGNVQSLTVIHSSSSAKGPTSSVIDPRSPNAVGRGVRVEGVYKWDTEPDKNDNATQTSPSHHGLVNPEANPR